MKLLGAPNCVGSTKVLSEEERSEKRLRWGVQIPPVQIK